MKRTPEILLLFLFFTGFIPDGMAKKYRFDYLYKELPFEMKKIDVPAFSKRSVSIDTYGAKGDGKTLCTDAINRAILELSLKGGGTVIVPPGVWFTGPVVLQNNINLHLQGGAILLFSPDKDLYPLVETSFEGLNTMRCQSPVSGRNLTNIAITGQGAIDGNGHYWRPVKKEKVTESMWKKIISRGGAFKRDDYWMPSEQYVKADAMADMNVPTHLKTKEEFMTIRDFLRPVMVSLISCKNVWLQGVVFQNSPAWNLHPLMCENLIIENVTVRNPSYSANGDGLDLESCKNTILINSTFDVGDDGICIKSGKDLDGRKRAMPCENLIVDNCTVFKGHGGFVVGSEMSGGVKNMKISNCKFLGTDVGLRFKSKRGRGGVVENIFVENISMFDIATEAVLFDLYYQGKSAVEMLEFGDPGDNAPQMVPVDETTPTFRNIHISKVNCSNAGRAMFFNGLPENPIKGIYLNDIHITARKGAEIVHSSNIKLTNIHIETQSEYDLKIEKSKNIELNAVSGKIITEAVKSPIDRYALVNRNSPQLSYADSLSSFSVGNGEFAFTADVTGLQTFPEHYTKGVPLGTQSQWGWHSFANPQNFKHAETLKNYNFRGKEEPYSVQFNEPGRNQDAANWYRVNPHRLHLGIIGFDMDNLESVRGINQKLDLWNGIIRSDFTYKNNTYTVQTACHPESDMIGAVVEGKNIPGILFRFAYPSGNHVDDGCDWNNDDKHSTQIVERKQNRVVLKRIIDATSYYLSVEWQGNATFVQLSGNKFSLKPEGNQLGFTAHFTASNPEKRNVSAEELIQTAKISQNKFWQDGAAVDFSECTDKRAAELERRVVLSQYLLAIQCAGSTPPQETGLTYNSWYGKFHLEMIWWHQAQFALWNRAHLLEKTLAWYFKALPVARQIAERQGFNGARWMKMTDPSGFEAPSKVGSFLIWQQPHIIYLAELVYRNNPSEAFLKKYAPLIDETARFMHDFADYDMLEGRYILKGAIPAQETLRASETVNPPFELAYWHFAMNVAQQWRLRLGQKRNLEWDEMIDKLSPLAYNEDKMYLAAETAVDTYKDIRFTSDHMAVLGAFGIIPSTPLVRKDYMQHTLNWIWDNWNWGKTWGWDYPMTAMNAARLGDADKAVGALLMDKRTNTYLPNGHNYQDSRLRVYLPGNGGLLTAVAMMCAGWDGCKKNNPGFPDDGTWKVKWEGLKPAP